MKKFFLLSLILLSCISVYAQILTGPSSTNSGSTVVITVSGESNANGYIFLVQAPSIPGYPIVNPSTYTSSVTGTLSSNPAPVYFQPTSQMPTKFSFIVSSGGIQADVTATFVIIAQVTTPSGSPSGVTKELTYTVVIHPAGTPPLPTQYGNVQAVRSVLRSNCNVNNNGGAASVPYQDIVAANTYISSISQADADQQAQAYLNAHAQGDANLNGACNAAPVFVSMTNGTNLTLCPNGTAVVLTGVYSGTVTNYNWSFSGTDLIVVSGGTSNSNTVTVRAGANFTGGMVKMQPVNINAVSPVYTQWTPALLCHN